MDWEYLADDYKPEDDYGVAICYDVLDTAFCGSTFMTPVADQGFVDCCVAFTVSAALGALSVVENLMATPPDFSKQQMVDCLPILPGGIPYSWGFYFVKVRGLHLEVRYPYEMRYKQQSCKCCEKPPLMFYSTGSFRDVHPLFYVDEILKYLLYQPLAAALPVYQSFSEHHAGLKSQADLLDVYTPEEGEDVLTSSDGSPMGHAVLVIGYSMYPQPCYIIKSWSDTFWGCKGYARVAAHLLSDFHAIGHFRWLSF